MKKNMGNIEEYADLKRVKLMKPGLHNGKPIDAAVLDLMARSTMQALDYLHESIELQQYTGNPSVNTGGKPIPALLNLNHQEDLAETMLTAMKGVKLDKMYVIDEGGEKWLAADYSNVPADVAKFVKTKYPSRSVEILPPIYHPKSQKVLPYVVRSVALLDASMPPAVKGQQNDFVVMYSALDGGNIETYCTEVTMEDVKKETTPTPPGNEQQIAEFKAQLDAQKAASEAELKRRDEQIAALTRQMQEAQAKSERQEIDAFCDALVLQRGAAPAALSQDVRAQIARLDNGSILEFADGAKKTQRQFWCDYLAEHVSGAVPQGQIAAFQAVKCDAPKSELDQIEEFRAQAEKLVNDPKDGREVFMKMNDLWLASKGGK